MTEEMAIIRAMREPLALPDPPHTPAQGKQRIRVEGFWELAAHLFYRARFNKEHEIPISRKLLKRFEPWVSFLLKKWELCKECHAELGRFTPYGNASEWFGYIITEMQQHDFQVPFEDDATNGKREEIEKMRAIAATLESGQNPYSDKPSEKHIYRLVEAARLISKHKLDFNAKYFFPCVRSYRGLINAIHEDKEIQAVFESGDDLYKRIGPGAGKRRLRQ